ncbi:MAG: hypothetical protein JO125_05680 [Chloroflexi bacterium]|nr:hypothetical protein [Ktedonobacteraceae bacterium]MBV9706876.1 hypothetical protein [Chloroflexota bacterium]
MQRQALSFDPWKQYSVVQDIDEQDTQPLPIIRLAPPTPAMMQENRARFRQLKAVSEASGVRFLFVYLWIERGRHIFRQPDVVPRITRALYQLEEQGLL